MEDDKKPKKELSEEDVVKVAAAQFFEYNRMLDSFKSKKDLSRKGMIRAIQYALNEHITTKEIRLTSATEAQLAGIIFEMLGARTIMQADILNRLDKENDNGEEEKELAGNRDSSTKE